MGEHNAKRVDQGSECSAELFSRLKLKARAVVGRGDKSLLSNPGSGFPDLGYTSREYEGRRRNITCEENRWDQQKKKQRKNKGAVVGAVDE